MATASDKPKILIVDDREYDRILYKEYLGELNFEFHELDDGEHLISYLLEHTIDLIILDWQMPRVGGLESLKNLNFNQKTRDIPVIVVTGQDNDETLEGAFQHGATDFITKPITKIQLKSRIQNSLNLLKSKEVLIEQKKEMETLNEIIRFQKNSLEESLSIKSDLDASQKLGMESDLTKKRQKIRQLELQNLQVKNALRSSLKELDNFLKSEDASSKENLHRYLKKISREIKGITSSNFELQKGQNIFDSIDPEFSKKLMNLNPKLTNLDLKHCAFIKLNMDTYEVSKILNVETKSLQMTRYRLKKKLALKENQSLREFILNL